MVDADMESFRFRQLLKGQAVAGLQLTWKAMTSFEGLWRFDECSSMSDEDAYASALRVRLQEKKIDQIRASYGTGKFMPRPGDSTDQQLRMLKDKKNLRESARKQRRLEEASMSASASGSGLYSKGQLY